MARSKHNGVRDSALGIKKTWPLSEPDRVRLRAKQAREKREEKEREEKGRKERERREKELDEQEAQWAKEDKAREKPRRCCAFCKRRKIKCDKAEVCGQCAKRHRLCEYPGE
ncbi:hypothetical protein MMC15_000117 [Xylographa vitiligo]|nr:hypothetical protein [Xylographa vitiligo]